MLSLRLIFTVFCAVIIGINVSYSETTYILSINTSMPYCWKSALVAVETCCMRG